jgi:DNA-binding transcriptional regulator LsrR (DeoR family)
MSRANSGEDHWAAKLNEEKVAQIRDLYNRGWTQVKLAEKFGVSRSLINKIVKWLIWRD